jgi:transcriptional regulator with PAS, ATPase and Fis domain
MQPKWSEEVPVGITVCDTEGVIVSMNDRAAQIFRKSGGRELIGKNLLACHPEQAQKKVLDLFDKKQPNAYTVEKNGIKSLLYQSPWYEEGKFMGFVEFIFTLPEQMAQLNEINWVK